MKDNGKAKLAAAKNEGSSHCVSFPALAPSLPPRLTLVTEQASPTFITGTLPRDAAGAVATAIVGDTFIAQTTLPTWATAVGQKEAENE